MAGSSRAAKVIAVSNWRSGDGISEMLCHELRQLRYDVVPLPVGSEFVKPVDTLITFGPYGQTLPVWQQASQLAPENRPVVIHWNTEGMPDIRLPVPLMRVLSRQASWLGRAVQDHSNPRGLAPWMLKMMQAMIGQRLYRFRYTGDYDYAQRRGWLHVLADTSAVYARLRGRLGIPTVYAPWGAAETWHANLNLSRDIDVLWMGTRGSSRRSRLLDHIRRELQPHGVRMHVADNVENPFIFNLERTRFLNRAKITLNLTRTWFDDNFSRFALAASNRSLIVSEPMLPHCPSFEAGRHFVSVPMSRMANAILYYLEHEPERQSIVEQAHQLVTTQLNFRHTLRRMLEAAANVVPESGINRLAAGPSLQAPYVPEVGSGHPEGHSDQFAEKGLP